MNDERKKSIKEVFMFSDFSAKLKNSIVCLSGHKKHQDRNIYDVFNRVFVFKKSFASVCAFVFAFVIVS